MRKPVIRLQLCGRLAVEVDGRDVTAALGGGRNRVLIAWLAAHRHRGAAREELVEALWPWGAPAAADASLSALLSRLRRVLGPEVLPARGEVRLLAGPEAWVDLEALDDAVHRAESAVALRRWDDVWGPAMVAIAIARRGFLVGEDAPWVLERRGLLQAAHVAGMESYVAAAVRAGGCELPVAERVARRLVAVAPFRERGHELLMEALVARGNVAEALRAYEALRELLRDELGAAPSPALRALQQQLLRSGQPV
ncbi:Regulatory protein AfsR [Baekduia alba]|uniref:AfsR/SARP family transcriptional regulator n=1 Tax=Baekduia alba TaxID=2997333 RepID=UPI002340F928|nr:BTAD domain-containing putative transcriptional regulator [Baekduia alba]WCB96430.1 Regulatory protein AfsR [Baekduia alba]